MDISTGCHSTKRQRILSLSLEQHKSSAPQVIRVAVVTISDTRTLETDKGGQSVIDYLKDAGHSVVERFIVPDEPTRLTSTVEKLSLRCDVDAILMTGGTGISGRDQTYETLLSLLDRSLPGYGELFRMLSFEEIGSAAMLSRATGGLIGQTLLLSMPGSTAAIRLAMEKLILPELGHLVREAQRQD